jgi:hypothetical protein
MRTETKEARETIEIAPLKRMKDGGWMQEKRSVRRVAL